MRSTMQQQRLIRRALQWVSRHREGVAIASFSSSAGATAANRSTISAHRSLGCSLLQTRAFGSSHKPNNDAFFANAPTADASTAKKTRPTVQVLHNPKQDQPQGSSSYSLREKEIAAIQAKVRDAYNAGDYDEALEMGFYCEKAVKEHFGMNHAVYASTLCNIALMQKSIGELPQSIEYYKKALEVYKEAVGDKHASYATTLHNLGLVYRTLAQMTKGMEKVEALEGALQCFEESFKIRQQIFEPGHADLALSMCNLGIVHWHHKQKKKAIDMLTSAQEMLEKKNGRKSPLTLLAMNNLAFVRKENGEFAQAIELYDHVWTTRKAIFGEDHPETLMTAHNLAEAYRAKGDELKAQEIQSQILEFFDEIPPNEAHERKD